MKKLLLTTMLAVNFSTNAFAADPCEGLAMVKPNSWLVAVNVDDATSKEGLLSLLDAFSNGGFEIRSTYANQFERAISLRFNPTYWSTAENAKAIKDGAFEKLLQIDGIRVECNAVLAPASNQ